MANSKFAIYLRATGTLRVSPDVGLRRWIAGTSPGQGRIEFVAAAWILYGDWGQGRCVVFCISREKAVWYRFCENKYKVKHNKCKDGGSAYRNGERMIVWDESGIIRHGSYRPPCRICIVCACMGLSDASRPAN